jgi:FixJ family two-component response regulator
MLRVDHITVVDDDLSAREALSALVRSFGFEVEGFVSAETFLDSDRLHTTRCLIVDVRMPGMSGFELQDRLNVLRRRISIIFVTSLVDIPSRARALESGAVAFLSKPVDRGDLLRHIRKALMRAELADAARGPAA